MSGNRAKMRRIWTEAVCGGNVDIFDEFVSKDFVLHTRPEPVVGREEAKVFTLGFYNAFPGAEINVLDQMEVDDKVITRFRFQGTQTGEFAGAPASGRKFDIESMSIARFSDGVLMEEWEILDELMMLRQLGLVEA